MSQENVERVRRGIEAFNRGDLDAALAGMHPDIEWRSLQMLPDAATYRGREGVREFWNKWHDAFRDFRLRVAEFSAITDDHVLAVYRATGAGAESGAGVESPTFVQLFELRDGQLIRTEMFQTRQEALEAAGVRE